MWLRDEAGSRRESRPVARPAERSDAALEPYGAAANHRFSSPWPLASPGAVSPPTQMYGGIPLHVTCVDPSGRVKLPSWPGSPAAADREQNPYERRDGDQGQTRSDQYSVHGSLPPAPRSHPLRAVVWRYGFGHAASVAVRSSLLVPRTTCSVTLSPGALLSM
jgi:hypothetical protein